jgi:ribose transport system substrate-binding protein
MKGKFLTTAAFAAALCVGLASAASAAEGVATGDTSGKVIVLSNSYASNAWRQAMLKSWDEVSKDATSKGIVKDAPSFTTAQNTATDQSQQIQNLILQGVDAIVLNAASSDALNGVVKSACDAGIIVVSFDGIVSEPCAYRVFVDFAAEGTMMIDYLAERLDGKGNILEVRGVPGIAVDTMFHEGIEAGLAKYPDLKLVGSPRGDWINTVAQREVSGLLPTLPEVHGVTTQGGGTEGYGALQAFLAAGRQPPIIVFGNGYGELTWWKEQRDANGYETMSTSIPPATAQIAFWVAQQLLAGKTDVPKDIVIPPLVIDQEHLDYWLERTPEGSIANATYGQDWTAELIDATVAGKPLPETPTN